MKRFAFLSVACGVVFWFAVFSSCAVGGQVPDVAVGKGNAPVVESTDLSETAQVTIPQKVLTKSRPMVLVIDFDTNRVYYRWRKGYVDGKTVVWELEDAYTFIDEVDAEGNKTQAEGSEVILLAQMKALLTRLDQLLATKGKK